MTIRVLGPIRREGERSEEDGHRDYQITFLVETTDQLDGPQAVTFASGLPAIGSAWTYGNDSDVGAYCTPYIKIQPSGRQKSDDPVFYWELQYRFTSRPLKNCQTSGYDNPILRPDKVSGSFVERQRKVRKDRNGNALLTTSKEEVEAEVEASFPTVRIEQYWGLLELPTLAQMVGGVNDSSLWGLAARTIKLGNVSWEKNQFGTCFNYYTRSLEFEIDYGTWDRSDIPNKGQKMIRGKWTESGGTYSYTVDSGASVSNAFDYIDAVDVRGNSVENYLNTSTGAPSSSETFLPTKELRNEYNFLALGIPTIF